jgi:hypothetical protein
MLIQFFLSGYKEGGTLVRETWETLEIEFRLSCLRQNAQLSLFFRKFQILVQIMT